MASINQVTGASRSPTIARPLKLDQYDQQSLLGSTGTSSCPNFENDLFAYDPNELRHWELPADLFEQLPGDLCDSIAAWQCAAAAVCSGAVRLTKMEKESIHRGWPERSSLPPFIILSATLRNQADVDYDTPPESPHPDAFGSAAKSGPSPLPVSVALIPGVETPPITPFDTQSPATPINAHDCESLDLCQIENSTSLRHDSVVGTDYFFHEPSWANFANSYKAELQLMHETTLPRLKDCIRRVKISEARSGLEGKSKEEFERWWCERTSECHDLVAETKAIKEPTLELVKLERLARGLPL